MRQEKRLGVAGPAAKAIDDESWRAGQDGSTDVHGFRISGTLHIYRRVGSPRNGRVGEQAACSLTVVNGLLTIVHEAGIMGVANTVHYVV